MKSKALALLATGLLSLPGAGTTAPVTVGSNEWRQLTDTIGFTWTTIHNDICNLPGNACAGTFTNAYGASVNFDGWTWASQADVRALFDAIIDPATANFSGNPNLYNETAGETYIDNAIAESAALAVSGQFIRTILNCGSPCNDPANSFVERYIVGWSSTATDGNLTNAFVPNLHDGGNKVASPVDSAVLSSTRGTNFNAWDYGDLGVWLRRGAVVGGVPEPGSLALLGLGLAALWLGRRHRAN